MRILWRAVLRRRRGRGKVGFDSFGGRNRLGDVGPSRPASLEAISTPLAPPPAATEHRPPQDHDFVDDREAVPARVTTIKESVVHIDPEILRGTPVFVGTGVPVNALLDYLEAGYPLDEFLDDSPSVSGERAVAALEEGKPSCR